MVSKTALQKMLESTTYFPLYINRATMLKHNAIEKMKLAITATLASFLTNCSFFKPLNPIIGETVEGHLDDGTRLFGE